MHSRAYSVVLALALIHCCMKDAHSDTKSGEVKLLELKPSDAPKRALKVALGENVKADALFYIIPDYFGKKAVSVQARVTNTAPHVMYYGYYVAMFDKDKHLIATSSYGNAKLGPGEKITVANVIEVPTRQIDQIASYEVTLLEDEKEFGK